MSSTGSIQPGATGSTGIDAAHIALERISTTGLGEESLLALSDDELITVTRAAEEVGRRIDAIRVLTAGEIAHRSRPGLGADRLSARRGCRTPAELLQRLTQVSGRTARERIRSAVPLHGETSLTGELLPGAFSRLRDALAEGAIGIDAAHAIIASLSPALDHGANPTDVEAAEACLLEAATGVPSDSPDASLSEDDEASPTSDAPGRPQPAMSADEIATMATVWKLALDPDGTLPDNERGMRTRSLTLGRLHNGTVSLRGNLLPEVATQLQLLFDAILNPRHHATPPPRALANTTQSDPPLEAPPTGILNTTPTWDPDLRTHTQRRHDALATILTITASNPEIPQLGGTAPTLVVSISPDQLADPNGIATLMGEPNPTKGFVPTSVARQIGCTGALQRLASTPNGRLIAMDSPHRVFTAHQRRAITHRDGGCIIPGCTVPASWCEIHHVTTHHEGGPTHTDNGVLLCWYHHRTLDTNGWHITMKDGLPHVTPPPWIDPTHTTRPTTGSLHHQWSTTTHPPTPTPPRPTQNPDQATNPPRTPHTPPPIPAPSPPGLPPTHDTHHKTNHPYHPKHNPSHHPGHLRQ